MNDGAGDTDSRVFWFVPKWSRIHFSLIREGIFQAYLSVNAVSPERAKRRILAALWWSGVLRILQRRIKSQSFWLAFIHFNFCISLLPQGTTSQVEHKRNVFTNDSREWLHKQVAMGNSVKSSFAAWRCKVEPDGSVKWKLASSLFFARIRAKKMVGHL